MLKNIFKATTQECNSCSVPLPYHSLLRFFGNTIYSRLHANQTDGQTNIVKFSVDLTSEFAVHDHH